MFIKRFYTQYNQYYNKIFKNMIKNDKLILGRWEITHKKEKIDRKVYLANYDNCGPCGNILEKYK